MTKLQIKFYNLISNQIIDFDAIFHKDFIIERINKIDENKLKYLLEDVNTDKDKIVKGKTYMTYVKFIHYADKMINEGLDQYILPNKNRALSLIQKRNILINTIEKQQLNIEKRNNLIKQLEAKELMFKGDDGKNILDKMDYFIVEKFGFYNFFDENKNYKLEEQFNSILENHTKESLSLTIH